MDKKIEFQSSPKDEDIHFLTEKINQDASNKGIKPEIHSFAFFIRDEKNDIIAGANGFVIYGSIYTDQLWVEENFRNQGLGKMLMEKIHEYGKEQSCKMATVSTLDFQEALLFYQRLGYKIDFVRDGYTNNFKVYFLKRNF